VNLRQNVRKQERRVELLIPLALAVIAVPLGLLVYHLDQRADALRQADHLVRSLDVDVANIRALEWEARAVKRATPALLNEATLTDRALRAHVDSLARNGGAAKVVGPAHRYEAAFGRLLVIASSGNLQASGAAYATSVAPAERRLTRVLATETVAIDRASEQAQNRLMVETIAGLLAGAALVLLLALRVTRFRAAQLDQERAANDKLRQLDAVKDEFVALVSHELRTPLTSIVGYVELLLERDSGKISDEQERYLQVVARNSQRLQRLVGDLLFIARYHAGKFEIERAPIDVGALARDCVAAASPTAQASGVELVCAAKEPIVMSGDEMQIAQLLDNLVSNALKFTPRGGHVELRTMEEEGAIVIEVADTGTGIPKELQEHLFERFFRTPEATKQAIQGTGLGLAISRAIVEAHGGEIGVESGEDAGTTFRVTFPRAAALHIAA
jgi:signal transduction histidine kinase